MGKRKVALALGLVAAAFVLLCGLGLVGLWFAARAFSAEPEWALSAAVPAGAERLHGVKIPPAARNFHARESGFQDPMDELIFELAPGDVARFIAENKLARGEAGSADAAKVL